MNASLCSKSTKALVVSINDLLRISGQSCYPLSCAKIKSTLNWNQLMSIIIILTIPTCFVSLPSARPTFIKQGPNVNPLIRLKVDSHVRLPPTPISEKASPTKISPTVTWTLKHLGFPSCRVTWKSWIARQFWVREINSSLYGFSFSFRITYKNFMQQWLFSTNSLMDILTLNFTKALMSCWKFSFSNAHQLLFPHQESCLL